MERPDRRRLAAVAGLVLTLVVAGCVTADRSVTTSGATLDWRSCGRGLECATLEVPVDHDRPAGRRIGIGVVRRPARSPRSRIGTLLLNPGGPGGSAVDFVQRVAPYLDDEVQDRFDLVGFDPRGVGRSAPLDCAGEREMYLADPSIEDADDREELLRTSRAFVDDCERKYAEVLPYLGTGAVVRDMEMLRIALDEDQLSYVGLSYGTSIGQVYADMFPKRVRAMVLDGVVDLAKSGVEAARAQAIGFERALNAFAADCRADDSCAITDDPIGAVERVVAAAERAPLPAPQRNSRAGPGLVALSLSQAMYAPSSWRPFADAVDAALSGDASGLVTLGEAYLDAASFEVYFGVSCLDSAWPDVEDLLAAAKATAREAPHFGESLVTDYVRCSLWPAPPRPLRPPTASGAPPIVVISTTNDPATPYAAGVALAERLDSGVLLTHEGNGHTATLDGDPCIDDAVSTYLIDLQPPESDTRC